MANIITSIRIICALALVPCLTFSKVFYALYVIGGVSDIFDGFVARHYGKETEFGAKLDTVADAIFVIVVLIKVLNKLYVPLWLLAWVISIAIIKVINIIYGIATSGHFVSEHTNLNKICGIILFVIPLLLNMFPRKFVEALIVVACVIATVAAIQEGNYIRKGKAVN